MNHYQLYAFADESDAQLCGQIAAMKRCGLDGLEIRNVDGQNVSQISLDKAREIRKRLDGEGLCVWSIGSPIGKIKIDKDDFNAHLEVFRHTLEVAHVLDAKCFRLFSFYMPKGANPEDYREEIIDRLGQLCTIAQDSGIVLCHENEKGIYGDNAARCLTLHRALPELRGVFDPANFVQVGQDTEKAWELLAPYIHYMHIKDALSDGSVVPAGKGEGHVASIVEQYVRGGGTAFTLEPHLAVFSGLAALEQGGNVSEVGKKYVYATNEEAFDAAVAAFAPMIGR